MIFNAKSTAKVIIKMKTQVIKSQIEVLFN